MPDAGEGTVGDIALVLHSHMPYVDGFGTYPFGEEWLFDAVIRSYLPVMEVARNLTVTVTPVLADQLESPELVRRLREFLVEYRIAAAEADLVDVDADCRPAAEAAATRYREALDVLDYLGAEPLAAFRRARDERGVALAASSASHAVLPLIATDAMRTVQVATGIASHRRRFGWEGGFWLPECAYEPGIEHLMAENAATWFCVDRSRHEDPTEALTPIRELEAEPRAIGDSGQGGQHPERGGANPVAFPIDWEAIQWLWSWEGYPSSQEYAQFAGKSLRGTRLWKIGGGAYDPDAAGEVARRQAREFARDIRDRLKRHRDRTGERGLTVYAFDTELLGHWWSEGPIWLAAAIESLEQEGVRMVTLDQAAHEVQNGARPSRVARPARSTWGEDKTFRTWDAPEVSDLTWAARRLELRLLRAVSGGLRGQAAERATRELLAAQASDWAFLDGRRQAGDYAYERVTGHSQSVLEAIESSGPVTPQLRAMAPDLDMGPIFEP